MTISKTRSAKQVGRDLDHAASILRVIDPLRYGYAGVEVEGRVEFRFQPGTPLLERVEITRRAAEAALLQTR